MPEMEKAGKTEQETIEIKLSSDKTEMTHVLDYMTEGGYNITDVITDHNDRTTKFTVEDKDGNLVGILTMKEGGPNPINPSVNTKDEITFSTSDDTTIRYVNGYRGPINE